MTALKRVYETNPVMAIQTNVTSLLDGDATGMFTTGSAPSWGSDALLGEQVGMFTTGSAPIQASDTQVGDKTEMFTTGS